jgi:hypothetical protein
MTSRFHRPTAVSFKKISDVTSIGKYRRTGKFAQSSVSHKSVNVSARFLYYFYEFFPIKITVSPKGEEASASWCFNIATGL